MAPLDQFILSGDSITQALHDQSQGFSLGARLQSLYIRRLDIINRGSSGYNTDHALEMMEHIIPTTVQASVRFLTIWFGANDSNMDTLVGGAHVPLPRFKENLHNIINHPLVKAQSPNIILFTCPPIEESVLWEQLREEDNSVDRTAINTAAYAEAVREVGKEEGVAVLDVWTAFMDAAGWKGGDATLPGSKALGKDAILADLLPDGLHVSAKGYKIVWAGLRKLIVETWPDQNPAKMPFARKVAWETALGSSFWDVNP